MSSYEEIINNTAERDGFRMSWNCWASNKLDMFSCVIPLGCMYTPLKELNLPLLQYEKISCCQINCKAVLNPFCIVDFRSKAWQCNLCSNRNDFPPHYSDISEQNLPSEMHESYSTIEYTTTNSPLCYPILYFLIDTCLVEEEMTSLKKSIVKIIQSLPDEWHVGLITFSRYVYVHDLSEMNFSKCYAFKPNKEYSSKKLSSLLEFGQHTKFNENNRHSQNSYIPYNRFVQPLGVCRDSFIQKINEIIIDEWPVKTGFRQLRSIGSALSIALSFLESTMPNTPVRVMLFNGGPCSYGNGNIVSELLKEPIRKHNDIVKDNAHYLHKALKYYDNLANKASNNGHTIDIYTASLDQTGLYEMRSLTSKTG
ncbi:hypothetical protein A3Q56_07394 [Intoshia linei]|uniref:Protein transport protein SEC23 n=1 Tax=Intoshia linei TaxID=1819745 RepID=A0A177ATQ7_9BILA|nr:hypothetical protein A3Q56_07394 [Intoshia linei]